MKKYFGHAVLEVFILSCLCLPYCAKADLYVDFSESDEIRIGSTEPGKYYALRIEEPTVLHKIVLDESDNKKNAITSQLPYHQEVMLAATETQLEPALIHAIIATESKHNAKAKSSKGAVGLMQLMPATARRFNVQDKHNPKQNILAGSRYLRELLTQFNGNLPLSLAAYNAGPGAVVKYHNKIPPYKETLYYVPKVLKFYRQYS
jgi:soluble lytic murein transglycosylase-like protein